MVKNKKAILYSSVIGLSVFAVAPIAGAAWKVQDGFQASSYCVVDSVNKTIDPRGYTHDLYNDSSRDAKIKVEYSYNSQNGNTYFLTDTIAVDQQPVTAMSYTNKFTAYGYWGGNPNIKIYSNFDWSLDIIHSYVSYSGAATTFFVNDACSGSF